MKAIDMVRWALQLTEGHSAKLVADMGDAPLTQPSPGRGNHTLWAMGHITFIEGVLVQVVTGETNPVAHWAPLFAAGTTPTTDAGAYPRFDEVVATFRKLRTANLKRLDEIGDAGLDQRPAWTPPGFGELMQTLGHAFLLVSLHQMMHHGQIADARRAAGRAPLM